MSGILEAFRFLDDMNATMAPSYSDEVVKALGDSLATDIKLLGHELLTRHQLSEKSPAHSTLAIWVDVAEGVPQAKLGFGDRERADWPRLVPPDAILVPFDNGAGLDGVPIDEPTLQQIGLCLNEEQWRTCFRSTGFIRSLLMLAGFRSNKEVVGA